MARSSSGTASVTRGWIFPGFVTPDQVVQGVVHDRGQLAGEPPDFLQHDGRVIGVLPRSSLAVPAFPQVLFRVFAACVFPTSSRRRDQRFKDLSLVCSSCTRGRTSSSKSRRDAIDSSPLTQPDNPIHYADILT